MGTDSVPEKVFEQAAAIPYRRVAGGIELLLITSLKKRRWIVPKGLVEADLTAEESAALEAYEEAGVRGRITSPVVGSYEYQKWGGTCRVSVFTLEVQEVLDRWPERSARKRKWVSPRKAEKLVEPDALKDVLRKAVALLSSAE